MATKDVVNFDVDLLDEMIDAAPTAGYGPNVNFGRCTFDVQIIAWEGGKGEKRTIKARAFKKGEQLANGEYLQITFTVDVPELNPKLENPYKRKVDVKNSGPKAKTDWSEIVLPSLLATFGKNWSKVLSGKGAYVMVEDAETVQLDKDGNKRGFTSTNSGNFIVNSAPKFVAVYKSKAECEAARAARFASRDNGSGPADDDGEIPAELIADIQGLMQAVNDDELRNILANTPPYNQYDVDELIKAAGAA